MIRQNCLILNRSNMKKNQFSATQIESILNELDPGKIYPGEGRSPRLKRFCLWQACNFLRYCQLKLFK